MSHFTVLVIGENPEEQLAPYDENLSVETVVEADGEEYTHNPDAKWDWYVLGGRWTGFFKLKDGAEGQLGRAGLGTDDAEAGHADSALKGNIDFDGMREEARKTAAARYDEFNSILAQHPGTKCFKEIRAEHPDTEEGLEATRVAYREQPGVKALREAHFTEWYGEDMFAKYGVPRDKFLERAANRAISTYAFIEDGKWVGSGDMGWWCISTNEVDEDEWLAKFNAMLDKLPDDTLLSVYDCHI